jgi:hypothetical protein
MLGTQWQKDVVRARRESRDMETAGYHRAEVDPRLHRGDLIRERLVDIRIAQDGKSVWYKISNGPHPWIR